MLSPLTVTLLHVLRSLTQLSQQLLNKLRNLLRSLTVSNAETFRLQ